MPIPSDNMLFGLVDKLNDEQRVYANSIFDYQLTIVNAPSGTGKTTLAVACAAVLNKPLYYVFSPVMEGAMGFRPGSQKDKEEAYIIPLIDALKKIDMKPRTVIYNPEVEDMFNKAAWVYPVSHVFMRGINLENVTIIIDECQNFTKYELKKVLTRIHDSCKVIMIGHSGQIDLRNPKDSGFVPYIELFRDKDYAQVCELTVNFRGRLATDADQLM